MQFDKEHIIEKLIINPAQPKTFVFDLDGTIIFNGKPLTKEFEHLLLEIDAMGHEIIFATGRSWRDFVPVVPSWCSRRPSVVFGGGLVIREETIKSQHFLPDSELTEIVKFLEDNHVPYLVDGHSNYYHPHKEHWLFEEIVALTGQLKTHSIDHIMTEGAYKVLVLEDKWLEYFTSLAKERNLIIKYHFYDKCFDIMPAHVNKYRGLCELGKFSPDDLYVFGNDHNDLELMQELPNSVMLGHHQELMKYAKLRIEYDDDILPNLTTVINTILGK